MSLPPSQLDGAKRASGTARFHLARRVPWGALAVVATSLLFLSLFYRLPISDCDEGIIAMGAERILRGEVPYRDFFSELGPGSFYLQAVIFRMAGESLTTVRLTAWILGGILSGLVYLLAKRLIPGAGAVVPAAAFAMVCYPSAYQISHHWWGNFFLLVSVLCLAEYAVQDLETGSARRRALLTAAGAFAAFSLLTMQSKGAWALAMGAAYLFLDGKVSQDRSWSKSVGDGLRLNFWFLSSASVVLILTAAYFLARGALVSWVEDNFLFLITNYLPYADAPEPAPWAMIRHLTSVVQEKHSLRSGLNLLGYTFFSFAGPALAFGAAAWRLWSDRHLGLVPRRSVLLFLLLGLAAFLSEFHSPDFIHLAWGAPLMLILLTYEWTRALRAEGSVLRRLAAAGAVLALLLMVFTGSRKALNTVLIYVPIETRRGTIYVATKGAAESRRAPIQALTQGPEESRQIIDAIQNAVPPGAETFFFPYDAELYFLTATRNPTRYDVLLPGFHSPQQIEETIASLRAQRLEYIFSFDRIERWTFRPHLPDDPPDVIGPHPVQQMLTAFESEYRNVREVAGMEVWALRQ